MTNFLSGKIYWVEFDFSFKGSHFPKKDETAFMASTVSNFTFQEHLIKFSVDPFESGGESWSYNVELHINSDGKTFSGKFSHSSDSDWLGTIDCELFEKIDKFLIYGRWLENQEYYTFWAMLGKNKM